MSTVPINLNLQIQIPYDDYVRQINERVQAEIESRWDEIVGEVRTLVNACVTRDLDNLVFKEVSRLVAVEVENAINGEVVKRAARAALKSATTAAVALALGDKPLQSSDA